MAGAAPGQKATTGVSGSKRGTATEFAIGTGRVENDPRFADWLTADDVAHAITTVLQQPRSVRTTLWAMWGMGQQA
jgi:3-oxoacyl-[acyl-carrier protein] reductase